MRQDCEVGLSPATNCIHESVSFGAITAYNNQQSMDSMPSTLAGTIRQELLHAVGVVKLSPNRRFAAVFSDGAPAEELYFVESGLVKLYKRGLDSKEIIVDILSAGCLFGQAAIQENAVHNMSAEILQEGVIYVIPREIFVRFCDERPRLWKQMSELALESKRTLEKKIELLCLYDVEHRVLYHLRELAKSFGVRLSARESSVPLSQGELAGLIGATRETTSTTLNSLARRGLVRLGRRQLVVIAPDEPGSNPENVSAATAQ